MVRNKFEVSSASFNISMNHEKYSTLLQAFLETYDEANKLILSNNQLKGLNNWLEERDNSLEKELKTVNFDFEHLNLICNNHEFESSKLAKFENYEVLQSKVKYRLKTSSKLVMGTANLNVVLGSQNCV